MIFGKTHKEVEEEEKIKNSQKFNWFAWRPVKLNDGRHVWLQKIYKLRVNMGWAGSGNSYTLCNGKV